MTNNTIDTKALHKIGYGLYVITSNDGERDNGMICNTVVQLSSDPLRIGVSINKSNYSHDTIKKTGLMNVNCLDESAPFSVFEAFGFKSGRDTDKFKDCTPERSENGLVVLPRYINAYMSVEVVDYVDLGSHGLFICELTESKVVDGKDSMTYAYDHAQVKPRPKTSEIKGYVCTICGYVHPESELPEDFECPLCKHPASDFVPIEG